MTVSDSSVMASRSARRLAITHLSLACCALESAEAIDAWAAAQAEPVLADSGAADLSVLIVAGTVTRAIEPDIVAAYEQLPDPKVVVAFGVCAISGGPYWDSYAVRNGIAGLVPVDVVVPGCPPTPDDLQTVLHDLAWSGP